MSQEDYKDISIVGPFDEFNIEQVVAKELERGYKLINRAFDPSEYGGRGRITLQFERIKRK